MALTRKQSIIVLAAAVVVIVSALMFFGVIPGFKAAEPGPAPMTLNMWGTMDKAQYFFPVFEAFRKVRPNVTINYRELPLESYEDTLINALASGKGPDIFMFHNTWLPKHIGKIAPAPAGTLSLVDFQNAYARVAEQDFVSGGKIYALPLYIDTLALIYNKDIFDGKNIALPPKNWLEVQNNILKIRQFDKKGNITLAGAAIGGSNNINRASDLLSLVMLQSGVKMTSDNFSSATFALGGDRALKFYGDFADKKNRYYTWNSSLKNSIDAFAEGSAAMIFDYASNIRAIKEKNPFVRIGISEMPQPSGAGTRVDYPSYYGLAVSGTSRQALAAWEFVTFMAGKSENTMEYLKLSKHPPALRKLIAQVENDPDIGVFARQALSARSWPQIDNTVVDLIFRNMIDTYVSGRADVFQAVQKAQAEVNDLMARRVSP